MLGYYFVGNIWVRSDFRLFLVDGGHSWINHESMGSIVCWIMLGSSIRSIMWWFHCMRLEKEGPTLVSLCVFYYFSSPAWRLIYTIFYIIFPSRPSWSPCACFEPTPCTKRANTLAGNIFLYASQGLLPPVLVSEVSRQVPEHRSSPIYATW